MRLSLLALLCCSAVLGTPVAGNSGALTEGDAAEHVSGDVAVGAGHLRHAERHGRQDDDGSPGSSSASPSSDPPPAIASGSLAASTSADSPSSAAAAASASTSRSQAATDVLYSTREAQRRRDVLYITVDDLRPQLGCTEAPGTVRPYMHTPNLCRLAAKSLVLSRSQAALATCSPSRTAALTGRHPTTSRVFDLVTYWRRATKGNFTSIPQLFKENGYRTEGIGKIFHLGEASGGNAAIGSLDQDRDASWTNFHHNAGRLYDRARTPDEERLLDDFFSSEQATKSWVAVPKNVTDAQQLIDTRIASAAVDVLRQVSDARATMVDTRPFFVAVGFLKPHVRVHAR